MMMEMGGPGLMMVFPFLLFIVYLALLLFTVYFMLSVLRFMKQKNEDDALLNQKLDLLLASLAKRGERQED